MRFVEITTVPFNELEKVIGCGPIHAVEVDHARGLVRCIHHAIKGIPDGAQPIERVYVHVESEITEEEATVRIVRLTEEDQRVIAAAEEHRNIAADLERARREQ